jgi:hypothetical protein
MSDELFDKLDVIENKSLFIRKLIERELDAVDNFSSEEVIPWSEGFSILKKDVNTIFNRLEEMENKLAGISPSQENQPLTQESLDPVLQETSEQIHEPQDNFTQNIIGNEIPEHVEQVLAEDIGTQNISENIGENHPDIPASVATGTDINIEDVHETASNELDIESFKTEDLGMIETEIPEPTVPTNIQETTDAVPSIESTEQNFNPMENISVEEQITPKESTVLFENTEETFNPSIPEMKRESSVDAEIPHEHKLSELVAEKIHKETEVENTFLKEAEKTPLFMPQEEEMQQPEFQMPELKPPEQEVAQPEFQMPELKPLEQEMTQQEFQMPELKPPEQEAEQQEFQMPEFKPPEQEAEQQEFQMPELKLPEQETTQQEFQMPELKPPEQEAEQQEFQMPEFKPPKQEAEQQEFQMPELKPPGQETEQPEFQMPEFKPPEQEAEQQEFQMPEFKPTEQELGQTAFAMPELETSGSPAMPDTNEAELVMPEMKAPEMPPIAGESMPPFNTGTEAAPEIQTETAQMQASKVSPDVNQSAGTKPDKLETNILMYMPRGAKVKKEIIKSLVSRQFSQEDIDRKIQELVAREILILKQENGVEQLHRLK